MFLKPSCNNLIKPIHASRGVVRGAGKGGVAKGGVAKGGGEKGRVGYEQNKV